MGAFENIPSFFGESCADLARKLSYKEENIFLLHASEDELKKMYPDLYARLVSCPHSRDSYS